MIMCAPTLSIDCEWQRDCVVGEYLRRTNVTTTATVYGKRKGDGRLANRVMISWHKTVRCLLS